MAERRAANIEIVAQGKRPELVAQYAAALQKLLEQQFPAAAGYAGSIDWRAASCVNPGRHSLQIQKVCRATSIKITRGRDWGIVVTVTPADTAFKKMKVIVSAAVPLVEGLKVWILKIAGFIGFAVGLVIFAIWIWLHPEQGPKRSALLGALFGVTVFLALAFAGFLLLSPLSAFFSSHRMRESVASGLELGRQAWTEMQSHFPGLPALVPKRSPAFIYAVWLIVALVVGVLSSVLPNWTTLSTGAIVLLAFLLAVAGVTALGMLLGVVVSLFGLMRE